MCQIIDDDVLEQNNNVEVFTRYLGKHETT